MRKYVSLDFKSGLGEAALAQFAHNALTRISGNPNFPTLQTLVTTEVQPAYDAYAVALQEAADRSRTKIAEKKVARQALIEVLETLAFRLSTLADNSESLILEAGFQFHRRGQRTDTPPEQVQHLRVSTGSQPGEVRLEFDRVPQARMYGVEQRRGALDQRYVLVVAAGRGQRSAHPAGNMVPRVCPRYPAAQGPVQRPDAFVRPVK